MSILRLIRGKGHGGPARALYAALVAQSRRPVFYRDFAVADTPAGRFEMIAVHACLVLHRLKGEGTAAAALAQKVFDVMFADMDQNLREMGIGDLAVGKRVKRLAQGFYGRIAAYERGIESPDPAVLAAALSRNLHGAAAVEDAQVAAMADYMHRQVAVLAAQPLADLCAGRVAFDPPAQ